MSKNAPSLPREFQKESKPIHRLASTGSRTSPLALPVVNAPQHHAVAVEPLPWTEPLRTMGVFSVGHPASSRLPTPARCSIAYVPTSRAASLISVTTHVPDNLGRFGHFGGRYVPETLTRALDELAAEYEKAKVDPQFQAELDDLFRNYVGRPSPLYHARRLARSAAGRRIYMKREDLNHTGAHKINNTLGQALLTLRMGKQRVIAETGAGQHGVATATACAASVFPASSTWARKTSAVSSPTCSA